MVLKRLFGFILFVVFVYHTAGYYLIHQIQFSMHREEVGAILRGVYRPPKLIPLRFNNEETVKLSWNAYHNQFSSNGQSYLVVKKSFFHGKTVFFCFHDRTETHLNAEFAKYMGAHEDDGQSTPKLPSIKKLSEEYLSSPVLKFPLEVVPLLPLDEENFNAIFNFPEDYFPTCELPPPQLVA